MKPNQTNEPQSGTNTPSPAKQKQKSGASQKSNVSLPKNQAPQYLKNEASEAAPAPSALTPTPAPPKVQKKKVRRLHQIPVTSLPEDEVLDEALDEMLDDENDIEEIPEDAPEVTVAPKPQNLYARIKERREQQAEQKMSTIELIRKKSGLTEDDVAMIFELGYESELGRLVGYDNLKKLKNDHLHHVSRVNRKPYRTAFGYCGEEYLGEKNKQRIIATYLADRSFLILRTILTALATLLLLVLDIPWLFAELLPWLATLPPLLFPILSTVILTAVAILSFRQLNAGLRSYLKLSPTPYSVSALVLIPTQIYDVVMLLLGAKGLHVNFLACAFLLLLSVCDVWRLVCQMRAFRLFSAEGTKFVLESVTPRKKKLRQGKVLVKIINDDIDERFYRVRRAEEATGFFRRFNTLDSANRPFQGLIGLMLALATLAALVCAILTKSLPTSLSVFMSILLLTLPSSAIFAFFHPLCRANKVLTHYNCALLGDESVDEYNEEKTVIFRDRDLYSAEKCTEISVRESDELRRDLRLAGILFRKIGGTLKTIGEASATKASAPTCSLVRIADNGLEAVVDNQFHMIAGNAEFLKKNGIRIPRESSDKALRRTRNVSMMYVAIDGVLKLSYEIEYTLKPDFEQLAAELADFDTAIAIQSYDPNLNESFLNETRSDEGAPIRVIKPGRYEADSIIETADTGAVALGMREDIVYPLHAAKRVQRARRFGFRWQILLSLLACPGLAVLAYLGYAHYVGALAILAYHVLGLLFTWLASVLHLNKRTLHIRRNTTK